MNTARPLRFCRRSGKQPREFQSTLDSHYLSKIKFCLPSNSQFVKEYFISLFCVVNNFIIRQNFNIGIHAFVVSIESHIIGRPCEVVGIQNRHKRTCNITYGVQIKLGIYSYFYWTTISISGFTTFKFLNVAIELCDRVVPTGIIIICSQSPPFEKQQAMRSGPPLFPLKQTYNYK